MSVRSQEGIRFGSAILLPSRLKDKKCSSFHAFFFLFFFKRHRKSLGLRKALQEDWDDMTTVSLSVCAGDGPQKSQLQR